MDRNQTKRSLLKKSIQILLSIFAFSILLTLSPLHPLSSHSLSNFSGNVFSYTPDRSYIFLFFNAIIAFLIKNSLPAGSSKKQQVDQNQTKQALLKKSIHILLSIFAYSIIFHLCLLLPFSSHSRSNFSGKIFSYTPHRNYIFLLANAILAFLIKNSLPGPASSPKKNFKQNVQNQQQEPELAEKKNFEEDPAREDHETLIPVEEEGQIFVAVEEAEEEEEDDGMGLLSTEELKKKFDDFIRKTREGIMIEPQQRIIL